MNRQNILIVTLLASSLTLSAVTLPQRNLQNTQTKQNSIASKVANLLHKRGLDEDVAKALTSKSFNENDSFALMLSNLLKSSKNISEKDVLDFLATEVLLKKEIKLDSYAYLVSMFHSISKKPLSKNTLSSIEKIAFENSVLRAA